MAWQDIVYTCVVNDAEAGKITVDEAVKILKDMHEDWVAHGRDGNYRPPGVRPYYERILATLPEGFVINE